MELVSMALSYQNSVFLHILAWEPNLSILTLDEAMYRGISSIPTLGLIFMFPCIFLKIGPFPASFSLFSSFQQFTVNMLIVKFCQWLDSNGRLLVMEATALPTEPLPQPVPLSRFEPFSNQSMSNLWHWLSRCLSFVFPNLKWVFDFYDQ